MALRSPIYVDTETLLSQAEYHDIVVPYQAEIVEKSIRRRSGGGKIGVSVIGIDASTGTDVEQQSTYTMTPREKATTSKVIDSLILAGAIIVAPDADTAFTKDQLVEIEGTTRITAASLAGKMFHILRRVMGDAQGDIDALLDLDIHDVRIMEQLRQVYLQNELLPLPILLELSGSDLPQKVYVNVRPDHFLEAASVNRIEGDLRVLGSVIGLVGGDDDGYLSAEPWLLHDYEYMLRRRLMLDIGDIVKDLVEKLELDLPTQDVHAYISGPALIVDAIAVY